MKLLKSAKSLLTKAYRNGYVQMILLWLALDVACSAGHRLERGESLSGFALFFAAVIIAGITHELWNHRLYNECVNAWVRGAIWGTLGETVEDEDLEVAKRIAKEHTQ
tara:strand:- start:34092 stop:34415 length:324 start_codon:yes stop_codon:yes gene_type:complete